jgi:type IV secretory pathway VirB2 component (pilin)
MADLLTSSYSNTYDNAGAAVAAAKLGANAYKHSKATSDAGRTLIVKIVKSGGGNITDAVLSSIINVIGLANGDGTGTDQNGRDAFTVAGVGTADGSAFVSGTTTTVFLRVQGTGTFSTSDAAGSTGATVTVEAVFEPKL